MRTQTTRAIGGRVNQDGTISIPGPYAARRTAAGDYTLTFLADRVLSIAAVDAQAGNYSAMAQSLSANSIRVAISTYAGALTDRPFYFTAIVAP